MKALTVFYDARCGLCDAFRRWLEREPRFVAVRFVPFDSAEARVIFPAITDWRPESEVLVLGDDGGIYRGHAAWIVCLWATRRYREWSVRLATPALRPFAGRFCRLVSENRLAISRALRLKPDEAVRKVLGTTKRCVDAESFACSRYGRAE